MSYIHKISGARISSSQYNQLSYIDKDNFIQESTRNNSDNNFGLSVALGMATDSALLGGLLGGDMVGGIIGDSLDGDLFD